MYDNDNFSKNNVDETTTMNTTTTENELDNSIINKVRSRVTNILPSSITKWFTQSTEQQKQLLNSMGIQRKRRDSRQDDETEDVEEYTDSRQQLQLNQPKLEQQPQIERHNAKRLKSSLNYESPPLEMETIGKHNIISKTSQYNYNTSTTDTRHYKLTSTPSSIAAAASTPTLRNINRKKLLGFNKNTEPYNFNIGNLTTNHLPSTEKYIIRQSHNISLPPTTLTHTNNSTTDDEEDDDEDNILAYRTNNNRNDEEQEDDNELLNPRKLNIKNTTYDNIESVVKPRASIMNNNKYVYNKLNSSYHQHNDLIRLTKTPTIVDDNESVQEELSNGNNNNNNINNMDNNLYNETTASESDDSRYSSTRNLNQCNVNDERKSGLYGSKRICMMNTLSNNNDDNNSGLNFYTHLQTKKSLFSNNNMPRALNTSTLSLTSLNNHRRHHYNSQSIFGSMSALSDSRLLNKNNIDSDKSIKATSMNSPFYNGRTMYGGASSATVANAYRKNLRVPTQIRPSLTNLSTISSTSSRNSLSGDFAGTSNLTTSSAISNTAKRILELMDQCTTPISDVKKMAATNNTSNLIQQRKIPSLVSNRQRFNYNDMLKNRSIKMLSPQTPYSIENRKLSSPGQKTTSVYTELQVPTMSQLLQMKKLQSNTEKVRELACGSNSILNTTNASTNNTDNNEYELPNTINATTHVSKLRNKKLINTRSSSNRNDSQDLTDNINLPEIKFPEMKSIPKIDLTNSNDNDNNINNNNKIVTINNNKKSNKNDFTDSNNKSIYKFSKPIELKITNNNKLSINNIKPINNNYNFNVPLNLLNQSTRINNNNDNNINNTIDITTNNNDNINNNNNQLSSIKFNPETAKQKIDQQQLNVIKPILKTSGSVLDVLKKPNEIINNGNDKKINHDDNKISFGQQFKTNASTWECSVCMIRNKNIDLKCIACENPQKMTCKTTISASTKTSVLPVQPTNGGFANILAQQNKKWECTMCMTHNDMSKEKCMCCDQLKPNSNKIDTVENTTTATTIKPIKKSTDDLFKNIVNTQNQKTWECSTCMTRNEAARNKCVCCEQIKPGATSPSTEMSPAFSFGSSGQQTFNFGIPNDLKSTSTTIENNTSNASGFVFGGQNQNNKAATEIKSSFSFGSNLSATSSTSISTSTSTLTSSASFTFGKPVAAPLAPTTPTFTFGKQTAITTTAAAATTITTTTLTPSSTEVSSVITDTTPISNFHFGSNASKSAATDTNEIKSGAVETPNFLFGNVNRIEQTSTQQQTKTTGINSIPEIQPITTVAETPSAGTTSTTITGSMLFGSQNFTSPKSGGFSFAKTQSINTPTTVGTGTLMPSLFGDFSGGNNTGGNSSTFSIGSPSTINSTLTTLSTSTASTSSILPSTISTTTATSETSNTITFGTLTSSSKLLNQFEMFGTPSNNNNNNNISSFSTFNSLPQQNNLFTAQSNNNLSNLNNNNSSFFGIRTSDNSSNVSSTSGTINTASLATTSTTVVVTTTTTTTTSSSTPFLFGNVSSTNNLNSQLFGQLPATMTGGLKTTTQQQQQQQNETLPSFGGTFGSLVNPSSLIQQQQLQRPPQSQTPFGGGAISGNANNINNNNNNNVNVNNINNNNNNSGSSTTFGSPSSIFGTPVTNNVGSVSSTVQFGSSNNNHNNNNNNNNNNINNNINNINNNNNNNNNNSNNNNNNISNNISNNNNNSNINNNNNNNNSTGISNTFGGFGNNNTNVNTTNSVQTPSYFDATATSFGNIAATNQTPNFFGNSNTMSSNDEPLIKKSNYQFSSNTTPTFGGTAETTIKTPFSFAANAAPNFNFTAGQQTNPSQPFTFGASSSTPNNSIFNFGVGTEATPNVPFQFGASPINNPFAAPTQQQGSPQTINHNATAQRRKIRAIRRTPR